MNLSNVKPETFFQRTDDFCKSIKDSSDKTLDCQDNRWIFCLIFLPKVGTLIVEIILSLINIVSPKIPYAHKV